MSMGKDSFVYYHRKQDNVFNKLWRLLASLFKTKSEKMLLTTMSKFAIKYKDLKSDTEIAEKISKTKPKL